MMSLTDYNLTPKAKKALKDAQLFAESNNHSLIRNEHIIYGCIINISSKNQTLFQEKGVEFDAKDYIKAFKKFCRDYKDYFVRGKHENIWHEEINTALYDSRMFAESMDDHFVCIEHILYILFDNESKFKEYLIEGGIDTEYLKDVIESIIIESNFGIPNDSKGSQGSNQINHQVKSPFNEKLPENLLKYCRNLNQELFKNQSQPIIGRNSEINQAIEILSKKNKSNIILVGDAGVGKTAIVEGLVQRIIMDDVPTHLSMYQVFEVDIASMVAGTQYRGQFEQRFKGLINEIEGQENIILFFDEIHTIVGAGSSTEGSIDAANMLKPALARGTIKCIGATTSQEYKKIFEKDSAMKRRFDKININEPTKEQTKEMIHKSLFYFEKFHNVKFAKKHIDLILDYCETYMPEKRFPDKAFDIIDQIGARTKIRNDETPLNILEIKQQFSELVLNPKNEDEFVSVVEKYVQSMADYLAADKKKNTVSQSDILDVFEQKTGILKKNIGTTSSNFSLFKNKIKKDVFGQDKILDQIYDTLSCAKVGLNDPDKPLANFLFVGPTSVGKTYTAKKIAKYFFGNEKSFIQINMSEYQDKTGISKLIGANAGYIGHGEGGILTEFVRNTPNCVVLFDEIEKCDPKILDILLHLLDEGYVSDGLNQRIDFSKSIVVMTTNIGHMNKKPVSVGFINDAPNEQEVYDKSLKDYLRPELLARINHTFIFNQLGDTYLLNIVDCEIENINQRLQDQNIKLKVSKDIKNVILNQIKKENLQARNIKTIVRTLIQTPIAKFIIDHKNTDKISIKVVDGAIKIC